MNPAFLAALDKELHYIPSVLHLLIAEYAHYHHEWYLFERASTLQPVQVTHIICNQSVFNTPLASGLQFSDSKFETRGCTPSFLRMERFLYVTNGKLSLKCIQDMNFNVIVDLPLPFSEEFLITGFQMRDSLHICWITSTKDNFFTYRLYNVQTNTWSPQQENRSISLALRNCRFSVQNGLLVHLFPTDGTGFRQHLIFDLVNQDFTLVQHFDYKLVARPPYEGGAILALPNSSLLLLGGNLLGKNDGTTISNLAFQWIPSSPSLSLHHRDSTWNELTWKLPYEGHVLGAWFDPLSDPQHWILFIVINGNNHYVEVNARYYLPDEERDKQWPPMLWIKCYSIPNTSFTVYPIHSQFITLIPSS